MPSSCEARSSVSYASVSAASASVGGQADLLQRGDDASRGAWAAALVVEAGAERGVERAEDLVAVLLLGRDAHPDRAPGVLEERRGTSPGGRRWSSLSTARLITCQRTLDRRGPSRPPASSGRSSTPTGTAGRTRSRPGSCWRSSVTCLLQESHGSVYRRRRRSHAAACAAAAHVRTARRAPVGPACEGCGPYAPIRSRDEGVTRARREPDPRRGPRAGRAARPSTRYEVALDVRSARAGPRRAERTFRSVDHDPLPLHAAGRVDLRRPARAGRAPRSRSTAARWTRRRSSTAPGSRWTAWRRRNELMVDARLRLQPHRRGAAPLRRPGGRRGLPLHAVRTGRRPAGVRQLRAAGPQGAVHLHGDRARRAGRCSATACRPATRGAGRRGRATWRFAPTLPISTYITAVVAGPYHVGARPLLARAARRQHVWRSRWARCAARSLARHFDADDDLHRHQAGPGLLPRALRLPVPLREVRPGVRAGVQPRRDGEPGPGHLPRGVRLPRQGDRRRRTRAGPT